MPVMPRLGNKAQKIAFKIIGKPANLQPKSKYIRYIDRKLLYDDTMRVR